MSSAFSSRVSGGPTAATAVRPSRGGLAGSGLSTKGKPRSFRAIFSRVINFIYTYSIYGYRKLRTLLWTGSTCVIFLVIPVLYCKLIETEIEFMRLERASDLATGRLPMGGPGGPNMRSF